MNKTILLVEDNASDEKLTVLAFKKCGVANDVVVVRDGAAALDYLFAEGAYAGRDPSVVPTVTLLDLKLPKIDGLEVLKRIKGDPRTKMIPVVMLTSSKEQRDVVESYQLGVNSYIVKPVNYERFTEAVRNLGAYWQLLNQPPMIAG